MLIFWMLDVELELKRYFLKNIKEGKLFSFDNSEPSIRKLKNKIGKKKILKYFKEI